MGLAWTGLRALRDLRCLNLLFRLVATAMMMIKASFADSSFEFSWKTSSFPFPGTTLIMSRSLLFKYDTLRTVILLHLTRSQGLLE
ncbi:hypothetical protein F4779DRAFT_592198 [Xylariaceae sp. FL0662B]|nr:hypothetical protein F4779DRAFT_592198 [Xylariaceae sp. FL0662B]